jgi:hypothetical protein
MICYQYQAIKLLFETPQKSFYFFENLYRLVRLFHIENIQRTHHHANFVVHLDLNRKYQVFIDYDSIKI